MYLKRLRIGPHELCLFALLAAATIVRFILISNDWPVTNSDEGNMGLLAMHIAFRGERPIFFYGQLYMGPLQGYVAAGLFTLFGVSLHTLRLALVLIFPLFLLSMYYLARLLYTRKLALATVLLLGLGSKDMISLQIKAVGEYAELELFAALISLLAAWLALSSYTFSPSMTIKMNIKRIMLYGVLGVVVGLALWVDFLIVPFLVTAAALLLLFCRRELFTWAGVSLLAGSIIGAFPLIIYNITVPLSQNSLVILFQLHHAGAAEMAAQHIPWIRQLLGAILIGLPMITGLNPRCALQVYPSFGSTVSVPCTAYYGSWALGYILLGSIAAILAGSIIYRTWRDTPAKAWSFEQRQNIIRQCARLMILASAGMTLFAYMLIPAVAVATEATARYLMCIAIAAPAILWPLWNSLDRLSTFLQASLRTKALVVVQVIVLLYIFGIFFLGTVRTFQDIPVGQANYQRIDTLVQNLLRVGATRIYSDYWTCNNLTFRSQEQIICSALDAQLQPDLDRYLPYRNMVRVATHPAYVFVVGSAQAETFAQQHTNSRYRSFVVDGYVIYQSQ